MLSLHHLTLLLLALVSAISPVAAETTLMRGSRMAASGFSISADNGNNDEEELEYLQKEMYWGMKEMNRYNALRGAWPVRDTVQAKESAPADNSDGCA